MTKKCPRCGLIFNESKFNWRIKGKQLAAYCKTCSRAYVQEHYKRNTKYYIDKAKERRLELEKKGWGYIAAYLKSHPCVDCGETDIVVLEFDHRERATKKRDISVMLHTGFQLDKLIEEISKCDIRCANCHRRKTHRENHSWKLKYN